MRRLLVVFTLVVGATAVGLIASPSPAGAVCNAEQAIFPTARNAPNTGFQLANGQAGRIERLANAHEACHPLDSNINTQNSLFCCFTNSYMEAGTIEHQVPFFGNIFYNFFHETTHNSVVLEFVEHTSPPPCANTPAPGLYHTFRIAWWWGGLWIVDINCETGAGYQFFSSYDWQANHGFSWGGMFPRTEFERFPSLNSINTHHNWLVYRDINTGNWLFWTGMACAFPQTLPAVLVRESGSAWHLAGGGTSC